MFVKICGITNLMDAKLAVKLGASAIGFIFAKSKREVSASLVRPIIQQLPHSVEKVGVFVDEKPERMISIIEETGLTAVQLHGTPNKMVAEQVGRMCKVIQVIKVTPGGEMQPLPGFPVWKILFDTYIQGVAGGSGKRFDWSLLSEMNLAHTIIAGGIHPGNVTDLLKRYRPFGIDLSSGVEVSPGKKDPKKLAVLFEKINHIIN